MDPKVKKKSALEKARSQLKKADYAHTQNTIQTKMKKSNNKNISKKK